MTATSIQLNYAAEPGRKCLIFSQILKRKTPLSELTGSSHQLLRYGNTVYQDERCARDMRCAMQGRVAEA